MSYEVHSTTYKIWFSAGEVKVILEAEWLHDSSFTPLWRKVSMLAPGAVLTEESRVTDVEGYIIVSFPGSDYSHRHLLARVEPLVRAHAEDARELLKARAAFIPFERLP